MPARSDSENIKFHNLNCKTGNRVQSIYVDDRGRLCD
jgi:non-homologous end joining protein Ku